ncbi:hypothetical protein [Tabrizicola oligotrophica]|uniref:Lipoprotein n=1 Tax=Tabrizicola oligotrophica TaxID=2710650 RepID=A0A6M0QPS8_9RHOB|nr:hypothetical protein [Tabrizicola oligotrophica]NEY88673.1 hypothetical protein [Tabrizicola oligotrophica]
MGESEKVKDLKLLKPILALGAVCFVLTGCSMSLPVTGQTETGSETFTGQATGYADGGGTLTLVSSKGRSCSGNFVYVTSRNGEGTFTCTNGQSGSFKFVSTGTRGTGTGRIGNEPFTFIFG